MNLPNITAKFKNIQSGVPYFISFEQEKTGIHRKDNVCGFYQMSKGMRIISYNGKIEYQ